MTQIIEFKENDKVEVFIAGKWTRAVVTGIGEYAYEGESGRMYLLIRDEPGTYPDWLTASLDVSMTDRIRARAA